MPYDAVDGGQEGALYLVAENTLFDKPDYSVPCYADFSTQITDEDVEYNYDKVFYGLPNDKDIICIWTDSTDSIPNSASGKIAKYYYQNINYFYKFNEKGDVWQCDDFDIEITCDASFQNWDTSPAFELFEGKIGGYNPYDEKNSRDVYVYETVYDQTLTFCSNYYSYDGNPIEYLKGKYYMKDENTMILKLTENASGYCGNYEGKIGDKLVFHKSSKIGEVGSQGKINLIDAFAGYPVNTLKQEYIKEFNYTLDDKQLLFAAKIEMNTEGLDKEDKERIEALIKGNELDKFGPSKKYYDIGLDWWHLSDDTVITSGETYCGYCGDLMTNSDGDYYYITKENGKYYYYAFCRNVRLSYDEVDKLYQKMFDYTHDEYILDDVYNGETIEEIEKLEEE